MRAAQINSYGDSSVIQINEISNPSVENGKVIIEVYASSINPIDWKLREGYLKDYVPLNFPVTLGGDFSGVVKEVGESVENFKVGDKVFGQAGVLNGGSGAMAEFALATSSKVISMPSNLDFPESASLPLVGVSAIQAIEEEINIQKDQKILIHGGAGGIGSIAIQIAKARGAYVATTVGTKDIDFVKSLGADEVIDFKVQKFEDILSGYDGVFDTVGGETTTNSFKVLKSGGILVSMAGQPDEDLAQKHNVKAIGQKSDATPDRLSRLKELIESGKVKPIIDKVFPFTEVKEAFVYQEKSHPRGKVVLQIK
ncbi:MAG TPA: NADP-dependent oxidoreductase [Patescibacteria group bacterium]